MKKILIISILTILVASFVYFIFDSFQTEIVRAGSEHNVSGWAWSDMVIGWISFNCSNQGVCGTSDYKVITSFSFNQPPNKPSNLYETWSHCSVQKLSIPIFHWTYSDPDGDPQAASHLKIYGETTLDTGEISCPSTCLSYTPLPGWIRDNLNWNKTYSWQVKVKDDQGNWSEWSDLNYFTMPVHAYPWVDFDWSPERPSVNEVVQFIDQSEVYGGAIKFSWAWTFQHGNPPDSNLQNPTTTFAVIEPGGNEVTLQVCDSTGYCCSGSKKVNITLPLPEYREVPPVIWLKKFLAMVSDFLNGFLKFQ